MLEVGSDLYIVEYEFSNYKRLAGNSLGSTNTFEPITEGRHNYSMMETQLYKDYSNGIMDACRSINCTIESFHTSSGHGGYEAVWTLHFATSIKGHNGLTRLRLYIGTIFSQWQTRPFYSSKNFTQYDLTFVESLVDGL